VTDKRLGQGERNFVRTENESVASDSVLKTACNGTVRNMIAARILKLLVTALKYTVCVMTQEVSYKNEIR
jgi:hypothetical protein